RPDPRERDHAAWRGDQRHPCGSGICRPDHALRRYRSGPSGPCRRRRRGGSCPEERHGNRDQRLTAETVRSAAPAAYALPDPGPAGPATTARLLPLSLHFDSAVLVLDGLRIFGRIADREVAVIASVAAALTGTDQPSSRGTNRSKGRQARNPDTAVDASASAAFAFRRSAAPVRAHGTVRFAATQALDHRAGHEKPPRDARGLASPSMTGRVSDRPGRPPP